jgi:hypothetical protein
MSEAKKSKDCPFTHPQIARKFPSKEVHKLCNDDTENADTSTSQPPVPITGGK